MTAMTLPLLLASVNDDLLRLLAMATETQNITIGARVSERLFAKIVAEQQRITKLAGEKPSINAVVRIILERGLQKNGKRR